ncbi:choice-of-anchor B family protein [Simiduia curdlanivorans]|uniref:Choice-of-anchor B family protein n=1 Tax=Simiduia curdlanivorans TaxID=1492769 RepID=A0ABV8V1P7_9GAMM|nr:choice-of-anchor B family protein [Simiduia curdlanivorans]MDN3637524.1 choice-of-anchor B family protein [Simiduia curdlanivorans]
MKSILLFSMITLLVSACGGGGGSAGHNHPMPTVPDSNDVTATPRAGADCFNNLADNYPCLNVDRVSGLKFNVQASDIWGWQDQINGDDYAFLALTTGTAFIRMTNPEAPEFVAFLPTATGSSSWRDVKQINDHAVVVSEAAGHGMQVVHIKGLVERSDGETIAPIYHYKEFGSAHNIAVNDDTNFAYVVGSNTCGGGLHMIDMNEPHMPKFAGCYAGDGYTHDVQCVTYWGDDSNYRGREICFGANEDTLTIVDVTDKSAPQLIAKRSYSQVGYTHQGWLTDDHNYFVLGDELDETNFGIKTRTIVFDTRNLANPTFVSAFNNTTNSIDHNLYVKGNHIFQANYTAGVRVLRQGNLALGEMREVAYFDTWPQNNNAVFDGVWSVFPFFDSGLMITANIDGEFFILRPNLSAIPECSDLLDNDADGATDYPADSSCSSAETQFEQ